MAEIAGKVGAFYVTSGTGTEQASESHTLATNFAWLGHKNVIVTSVKPGLVGTTNPYSDWICTPRGKLTVTGPGATASVNVKYRWWAEVGEIGAITGIVRQYGGFFNWSIDNTADVVETTDFLDSGHRNYLATLDGWTATAERHWVDFGMADTIGSGSALIAKFYVNDDDTDKGVGSASDQGQRYEGYAHLVGLSPSVAVDTLVNESLSFQGTGQLTYEVGA